MSVNELIINTLNSLGHPVVPDIYTGNQKVFITFNYADERGGFFTDNTPMTDIIYLQIHLYAPIDTNILRLKKQIKQKLYKANFTYPEIVELVDTELKIRHIIFQTEIEQKIELESEE